ncbi:L,D-transpeptidase family protein [Paenibacillus oceani]|uniref:L,D-transpeptidase family protein n=1 Tax=Paenibacillus oceani TaxID=2772510 RepID=A0A927CB18_9BACL|nr:L,D-transpeptidase family protein [Paenibacillus oceani]MBD2864749.1 L,D-transpeptidase family protein [Paenibacillus oceani]
MNPTYNDKFKPFFSLRLFAFVWLVGSLACFGWTPSASADPSPPIVAAQGEYAIEVYPQQHRLHVLKHGKIMKSYRVAVGNPATPTPIGEYKIVYKGENWGPSFGPRWLGLNVPWGHYGIHGTNKPFSIGQHQSHGCIRMLNRDVIELYQMIPLGTKVSIYGHVLGDLNHGPRDLAEGDVGGDVQLIQSRLKSAGYFNGTCNGKFRSDTTVALKKYQRDHRLPPNGVVSFQVYREMWLVE